MKKIDRIGEEKTNAFGSIMRIINYRRNDDIDVYFEEYGWTKCNVAYKDFNTGKIKCPYELRVFGVACVGDGDYKTKINGKHTKYYRSWRAMIQRCYDPKFHNKEPTYTGCTVHDSWLNFQVFAEWADKNYYKIEEEQICLDKDILCKGNKIYSPDTCIFVPKRINLLFTKSDGVRGDLPIGVYYHRKKYNSHCNINGKRKDLGSYDTPEEAFQVYKNFKEQYIKEVAEEYKSKIPSKLYEAMLKYEVEIDD